MTDQDHQTDDRIVLTGGKHKGTPITRVPAAYLKWMVSTRQQMAGKARSELRRRGTVMPDIEVSGHAVNRASMKCLHQWKKDRHDAEGLHAWLARVAAEALRNGRQTDDIIYHKGLRLVFEFDCDWPVLKTVMVDERKSARVRIINERSN